jgi:iron(III) transport system substrate-binding protein
MPSRVLGRSASPSRSFCPRAGPAHAQKQTVVIYTAIENEQISKAKKAYEKSLPNVDVKMKRLSTGDISAVFMAEKDNMQAT